MSLRLSTCYNIYIFNHVVKNSRRSTSINNKMSTAENARHALHLLNQENVSLTTENKTLKKRVTELEAENAALKAGGGVGGRAGS